MLFEKPSLRTRVSFDVGIKQLGGHPVYLGKDEVGLGGREAISDVAQVLSRYVDAIVARVYEHQTLEELAEHASVPVVNALSDVEHPCQALGDMVTIQESLGKTDGVSVAFIGDGNNVAASLALAAASLGASCTIASPEGYGLPTTLLRMAGQRAKAGGAAVTQVAAPEEAVAGADVVYTDVWVSMGQEDETKERLETFRGYQVNPSLMELAQAGGQSSCTRCRRTTEKRPATVCWSIPRPWCSIKQKTGCTLKKRCLKRFWKERVGSKSGLPAL